MLNYVKIGDHPVPIWLVVGSDRPRSTDGPVSEVFGNLVKAEETFPTYRGVGISQLGRILQTGVDVEPTDAPIYAGDIDKAWEYPDWTSPRAVFALRATMLEPSWRTLPVDAADGRVAAIREDYPNRMDRQTDIWFSRFGDTHPGYEMEYGYWIPGDAKEALAAVYLFGTDTAAVIESAKAALDDAGYSTDGLVWD